MIPEIQEQKTGVVHYVALYFFSKHLRRAQQCVI
jgi:hypothetical protein